MSDLHPVRRVVTGHNSSGRSVFVSDDVVSATTTPAFSVSVLWAADNAPTYPDGGVEPTVDEFFPSVGGFRFAIAALPPERELPPDLDEGTVADQIEAAFPGIIRHHESVKLHKTPTIDFILILSGECDMELDDGASVHLGPGDTLVQNGTRHKWWNNGEVPCVFAMFMSGART
jgi:mannose-6-phosphate isomerase-like protein (cupin superfamily)